jgi:hypothetical protein
MIHRLPEILWLIVMAFAIITLLVLLGNAIYINNAIPTLDGWELVDQGNFNLLRKEDDNCYQEGFDRYYYVIGKTKINEGYLYYTPMTFWGGFVHTSWNDIPLQNRFKLYKHNSLIPIWADYLIICDN